MDLDMFMFSVSRWGLVGFCGFGQDFVGLDRLQWVWTDFNRS